MDHLKSHQSSSVKVLMTGAGAPGGPGIIKALQTAGYDLYVGDANPTASGRFLNDKFVQLPEAGSEEFIKEIFSFCIDNQIQIIFPLVTKELFKLAEHKKKFADQSIKIIVSDYESLCIANDKGKLYHHLKYNGIVVPEFRIAANLQELKEAVIQLGYPQKAVCIKPTVSNGSRGVRILQKNISEYDLLFNQKPNNLYSTLERIAEILNGTSFPELLVAEYLPGEEYTIDTIVHKGIPKLILPRVRLKMNGGISVQGTFLQNKEIITYCGDVIKSLNLSGPIGLQVKKAEDGTYKILEINPRIQGTSVAAMGLGINLPALAVEQEFEEADFASINIKWGTSFVRYYQEIFY